MVVEEKGKEAEAVFTGTKARVEQEDALNTPHTRNIDPEHGWTRASACEGGGCLAREENHSGAHAQHAPCAQGQAAKEVKEEACA